MSASLSLSLRSIKKLGEQIVTKEIVIGLRTRLPSCGGPTPLQVKGSGEVEGSKTSDPSTVDGPPKGEKSSNNSS